MLFDSHAHLTDERVYPVVQDVLQRAVQAGVAMIANVCTDSASLSRGLELQQIAPQVLLAAAIPPHSVQEAEVAETFERIKEEAHAGRLSAIGETGLDYYYHGASKELQHEVFVQYLELAKECGLPIIIHCREAFSDFFEIIDAHYREGKGVLHCFTGTQQDADALVKRGWMVSFSGIVTFKKSVELQAIAKQLPLENLLIETDTPYLAPQKQRGKQNEPAFLVETAQFLANLKGIAFEQFAQATTANAQSFFNRLL